MKRCIVAALAVLLVGGSAFADPIGTIGVMKAPSFEKAKELALAEVKDPTARQAAEALWDPAKDLALIDRVALTLELSCPDTKKLLDSARNLNSPAPTAAPELLKDTNCSVFFRNNVGLYYAKLIATRRVHEEALETLKAITPEQSVDPASYYFFKAVAEHKLQLKTEGLQSVDRLLNNVADAPERYTAVASLMKEEMKLWKDKDLGYVARLMDDVARRFDLARGGKQNQLKQEEALALLDKMIKDLEKQCGA